MKVYFGRREHYFKDGKWWEELVDDPPISAEVKDYNTGQKYLLKTLEELDLKSHYQKMNFNFDKNWLEIDFGSWGNFFLFYDLTEEDWKQVMENMEEI